MKNALTTRRYGCQPRLLAERAAAAAAAATSHRMPGAAVGQDRGASRITRLPRSLLWTLALLVAGHATAGAATPTMPALHAPLDARQLSKPQFDALADDAIIDVRGTHKTAGELRELARRNAAALQARTQAVLSAAKSRAANAATKFEADERARLSQKNSQRSSAFSTLQIAAALSPLPIITSIPDTIEPGDFVPIGGRGFGNAGQVLLKGLGSDKVLALATPWTASAIGVTVPAISGVKDQSVTLVVTRNDGKTTERTVAFRATREMKSVAANVTKCGQDATTNSCEEEIPGFFARHGENTLWETDAAGCDSWSVTVKNGWVIHTFEWDDWSHGGGKIGGMSKPSANATSHSWNACWTVPGTGGYSGNGASYIGTIHIIGPKGVPFH